VLFSAVGGDILMPKFKCYAKVLVLGDRFAHINFLVGVVKNENYVQNFVVCDVML